MIRNKYANDYVIDYEKNSRGKLRATVVYKGKYFQYVESAATVQRAKIMISVLVVISWISFLLPMFLTSAAAHTWYIILPHACVFIPLIYMTAVLWMLWMTRPPLTREQSDKIALREPKTAFLMMLFSGIASIGFLFRMTFFFILMIPGDLAFAICEFTLLFTSYLLFRNKELIATDVIGS